MKINLNGACLLNNEKMIECCKCVYFSLLSVLGKSTLLAAIGEREIDIPHHLDIYHLSEEMPASDKTPLECVMEVDEER